VVVCGLGGCVVVSGELARVVRVVAVSPGDVRAERERLEVVVDELNRGVASERGCRLSLWRWETDAHPGLHLEGPQGLIDEAMRIEDADVVVGVFWKRFGTPTLDAGSGTEHELRRAWSAWRERGRPQVMVYFCERRYMLEGSAEAVQLQQVLSFRETLPKEQLWWRFVTVADFERAVRQHLTAFLLALEPTTALAAQSRAIAVAESRRVQFRLPLAAAHFTGRRTELDAIDEALGVAERAVVMQAITGLGGVGKSQLSARYVHEHAEEYDVVAWIRAEDGGTADLSELAAELGLPVAQLTSVQRAGSALRWLSGCDERWLLVLDNVASPEQLESCCPSAGNGRVIVTTRDRAMAQFGPALAVDVFDEPTAVEYLLATSGREDRDGAIRLARGLGFLPLALSHAGAYCAAGTTFDDYLELLGALPTSELFDDHPEASYAQTVASTWQVSIQAAERQAPLARQVLTMAAHLAPDAIPRALFEVLLDDTSSVSERKRLLDAFNALHRLSLAEVTDTTVSVHRLLQKTIRDDPVIRADPTAAVRALAAVAAAFPRELREPQTWPHCERLLPHALAITTAVVMPDGQGPRLVTLLNSASEYLARADPGARAISVATRAVAYARQLLGSEHPDTLRAAAILAAAYRLAGRTTQAIELAERTLADYERILGPEHPDALLLAGLILAGAYWQAGRTTQAIELAERVLPDVVRILGPEHPDRLIIGTILALSYSNAGRITEAIQLEERVLADSQRILGPNRPETLNAGMTLAFLYSTAKRTSQAIELAERVLADCVRILGPEHPDTLSADTILTLSYAQVGRATEAIEHGERILADCQRILGPEHPGTFHACASAAFAYQAAGRMPEAIDLAEQMFADRTRLLNAEHPYTLGARATLATMYLRAGRTDAIDLLKSVLADSERILGPEHPATLIARDHLADVDHDTARTAQESKRPHDA
jgi:tetratricopeptide (TPR) repeat protein